MRHLAWLLVALTLGCVTPKSIESASGDVDQRYRHWKSANTPIQVHMVNLGPGYALGPERRAELAKADPAHSSYYATEGLLPKPVILRTEPQIAGPVYLSALELCNYINTDSFGMKWRLVIILASQKSFVFPKEVMIRTDRADLRLEKPIEGSLKTKALTELDTQPYLTSEYYFDLDRATLDQLAGATSLEIEVIDSAFNTHAYTPPEDAIAALAKYFAKLRL